MECWFLSKKSYASSLQILCTVTLLWFNDTQVQTEQQANHSIEDQFLICHMQNYSIPYLLAIDASMIHGAPVSIHDSIMSDYWDNSCVHPVSYLKCIFSFCFDVQGTSWTYVCVLLCTCFFFLLHVM